MGQKFLHELTAATSIADADIILVEADPSGSFAFKKLTGANLASSVFTSKGVTVGGACTINDWFDQAVKAASSPTFAGVTLGNTGLHILDTNASHDLIIAPGSDLTADRTLTLTTGDADRTITLSGNPTLADWFDQSVKQAASPTFAGISLADNAKAVFGTGSDATIYYDGSKLIIDPKEVGAGYAYIDSALWVTETIYSAGNLTVGSAFTVVATTGAMQAVAGVFTGLASTDPVASQYGVNVTGPNISAESNGGYTGIGVYVNYSDCDVTGGVTDSGYRYGVYANMEIDDAGFAGTLTSQKALVGVTGIAVGAGTLTEAVGLYLEHTGVGTTTTAFGVFQATAAAKNYFAGNVGIGTYTFGTDATKTLCVSNGTAPSDSPADAFQMYSADQAAGNAAPHFRTEDGNVVKLYQQANVAAVSSGTDAAYETAINGILTILQNLGLMAAP